ncbi:MAG: hypothetical protein AAGF26_12705 [Cyanobacteria bacterium P01_G01_bin.49]
MAKSSYYYGYFGFSIGFGFLSLAAFFILQWLHIPAGSLVDWVIGIASFWWLLAIVTVPWNVYFEAKEVISEAATSQEKEITIDEQQLKYAKTVSKGALVVAIALHLLSTFGLYELAATGISSVGYVSSFATLLLTILRPAVRAYQYLAYRLSNIRQQIKYPRQDILELRNRFKKLEKLVDSIEKKLDLTESNSWISQQEQNWEATRKQVAVINAKLEQLEAKNSLEHQELAKEARNAISQLTEDSNFLHQVREIIRFIKTA